MNNEPNQPQVPQQAHEKKDSRRTQAVVRIIGGLVCVTFGGILLISIFTSSLFFTFGLFGIAAAIIVGLGLLFYGIALALSGGKMLSTEETTTQVNPFSKDDQIFNTKTALSAARGMLNTGRIMVLGSIIVYGIIYLILLLSPDSTIGLLVLLLIPVFIIGLLVILTAGVSVRNLEKKLNSLRTEEDTKTTAIL